MHDQSEECGLDSFRAELDRMRERERATQEILQVISESRADEMPVLDAIVRAAARLCNAKVAGLSLVNEARTRMRYAAVCGADKKVFMLGYEFDLDGPIQVVKTVNEARTIHTADLADHPLYWERNPVRVKTVEEAGVRTFLTVPLIKDGVAFGCLNLNRNEVRPFSNDDIALVETFAEQAVIAIENVRQFREVQQRLERERATSEVLEIISQSRDDETPVFRAILERAERLCGADGSGLQLLNETGTHLRMLALMGTDKGSFPPGTEFDLNGPAGMCVAVRERRVVHIEDLKDTELYRQGHEGRRKLVDVECRRTHLNVPLMRDGTAFGNITLGRDEVKPFTPDQIALVETFAAQAVIAIENVRQFKALETLNAELGDRVEEQVGEIERMGRLKRFLPSAVADTVVSSGSEEMLKSHRALLGVLFCDIRGFTAFCESAEPEETIEVLQTYHEEMGKLINAHGAGVDHRMGDGIMVLFNDPFPCDDPAGDAVRLAIAMRERMAELCITWKKIGHRLGFGVGVSLGYATVGLVGFEGRVEYSASGTAINLASRLCDDARDGEILLSPRVRIAVEDYFQIELRDEKTFKGIREPVEVFRIMDAAAI